VPEYVNTRTEFGQPSLSHAFAVQRRVIGALLIRELATRYGRSNIGFLWLFLEPMLFTFIITAIWATIRDTGRYVGVPIAGMTLTGYSCVLLWRNTASRCMNAIEPNRALMHHRNVKVLDIFAARILLEFAGATVAAITLAFLFNLMGWLDAPADILPIIIAWALLAWFSIGLGLCLGVACERNELVEKIWRPVNFILFALSGTTFMVDWLPPRVQEAALWVPMIHFVEMLRGGYFGPTVTVHFSLAYMLSWCLGMSLLGVAATRIITRDAMLE